MRDYRIDLFCRGILALTTAALLTAGPAAAQPISLAPPTTPPTAAPPGAPSSGSKPSNTIQGTPLQPVDTSWSGLMNAANGGFPHDMWNGASRGFVAAALPRLQPVTSPTLVGLARRLLLSDAVAPSDTTGAAGASDLLVQRLDRIYALGFVADGLALIRSLPATIVTEAIDRNRVELHFAANDIPGACRDVNDRIARYPGAWWARALIACQTLSGDFAQVSLGQSLLVEQKAPPDPDFDLLIRLVAERHPAKVARLGDPTPLRLALLAATKRPLPPAAVAIAEPAALAGYATNSAVPAIDRLAAAERAEALGVIPAQALASVYAAVRFTPDELARARRTIQPPANARDRAMLYVLAKSGTDTPVRVAAVAALAADAEQRGVFVPMAQVLAPTLSDIPIVNADPKFAGVVARILLAAGNADAAKPWITASGDKAALLLDMLALPGVPRIDTGLLPRAVAVGKPADVGAHADLIYALLSGLGVDPTALGSLAPTALAAPAIPGTSPNAALWQLQQQAARNGQLGQTVLATLLMAESGGRLTSEPLLLGQAVAGLRAVGLDADAHALALEAALDAGV